MQSDPVGTPTDPDITKAKAKALTGVAASAWLVFVNGLGLWGLLSNDSSGNLPADDGSRFLTILIHVLFALAAAVLGFILLKRSSRWAAFFILIWMCGELLLKMNQGVGPLVIVLNVFFTVLAGNGVRGATEIYKKSRTPK